MMKILVILTIFCHYLAKMFCQKVIAVPPTPLPILYSFRRCPYAMRARFALYTAQVSHEHREIKLKDKPQAMLSVSPKGTVPVLLLSDGRVLEQSLDIMRWALNLKGLHSEFELLIQENDTTFKRSLDRYKYPGRYDEEGSINYRKECENFLLKVESYLQLREDDDALTFLDMALFPFIRQFSMVEPEWFDGQPYPHLKLWLQRISSSPLFERIMQKYGVWEALNPPIIIKP
ncbi:MAG: glutathione S-transferase [Candidatus Paracaedibacteraceae bacterium]|nr:glutathione S-transferase [Candidatus Paracaedibacteraceae bacterium]